MLRCLAVLIVHSVLFAQVETAPAFEVASVKRNNSAESRSEFHTNPDGVTITNYRLRFLIPYAYGITVYQMVGAPQWLDSNKYDIVARAPKGSSEGQLRLMVQQLLVDRFGLKFHRERKDMSGYAVVLTKDGPKFTIEKKPDQPGKDDGRVGAGRGMARGHMVSSAAFAQALSLYLERPVLDRSGIDGVFSFELRWTPDEMEPQLGGTPLLGAAPSTDPAGPSLLAALQEQLGLKLVTQRSQIDMFVIDRLQEMPTEN
jgi:bla regulator protein blaR1